MRPRELAGLRDTLAALPALRAAAPAGSALLAQLHAALQPDAGVAELLQAIADEPAVLLRDGGVIAAGVDAELDELRGISQNCDAFLLDLEARERTRTGIPNLRVQFNKVHGFYIEVTASHLDKVPADYQRRQTLKNAERYITPELKTFEDKALSAQERALAREKWLYEQLLDALQQHLARAAGAGTCAGGAGRAGRAGRTRGHAGAGAGPSSCPTPASRSRPAATRWWKRGCAKPAAAASSPTTAGSTRRRACSSSPAPTWAARAPSCARWR